MAFILILSFIQPTTWSLQLLIAQQLTLKWADSSTSTDSNWQQLLFEIHENIADISIVPLI